ncbi:type II secretion system protein [Parapedobacter sp. 10938]|uniref:type II secretion system protein n=1 Tax=Parapedobacter flavus TaxID=3110225 RepID=UPI002DC02D46|nr:type II secretion system protein [Parapedobacter sp. 10938]MEC3882010.1 type II secretion system protein [Parapedobacter sp. 10938]
MVGVKKLEGSTLLEALVALVIITIVMAMAATLFVTVGAERPDNKVNMQLELIHRAAEVKRHGNYSDASFTLHNGIMIDMHVEPYKDDSLLLLLELKATNGDDDEVAVHREIIFKTDE